jgi:hypothetical protein
MAEKEMRKMGWANKIAAPAGATVVRYCGRMRTTPISLALMEIALPP